MNYLRAYSLALIETEGHFSAVKGSRKLPTSHDRLSRSLYQGGFSGLSDWSDLPPRGILIVDDTVIAKPHTKAIEGVAYVYSSSEKKALPGLTCQLVLWRVDTEVFVLDVVICEKGGANKNELFRQTVLRLYELGLQPEYVTFDAWYGSKETLNLLQEVGWVYVTKLKSNRILSGRKLSDHRFYGANSRPGQFNGVNHTVQVAKHGQVYLATNMGDAVTSRWVWARYRRRWVIETVFRDLKDTLHLEKSRVRSLKAQFNHILACLEAYQFLKRQFPKHSIQAAQQEFLCLSHNRKALLTGFLAYAA